MSHYELPLYKDQINSEEWCLLADYVYSTNIGSFLERLASNEKKHYSVFNSPDDIGDSGVIFCGQNMNILNCFKSIPENGNYILITRDNDNSITEDVYWKKPKSIKHWFAINCQVNYKDITAIPVGMCTTGGFNNTIVLEIENYKKKEVSTRIFSRLTITPKTHDRVLAIEKNESNPLCKIVYNNIPGDEFCQHVLDHEFVLAPIGEGADCLRMNESVAMGAIPICTDCNEIRHFQDLPIIFTADYTFTNKWLDEQKEKVKNNSTERLRMSYWRRQLQLKKEELGIL